MTTDPPPPGSPWATHCPDAFPVEWLDALGLTELPPGFARFATPDEVALIVCGAVPGEPGRRDRRSPARPPGSPSAGGRKPVAPPKPEGRFAVLNGFVDVEVRELTRAEMAVWLTLYRDTKPDGTARTGQTDLARRSGCDARTVRRAVKALAGRGLVEVLRVGRLNAGPSVCRVRGVKPAGS